MRDLKFLKYGLFNNYYYSSYTQSQRATKFANDIQTDTVSVQELQKELTFTSMELLAEHKVLLSQQVINMKFGKMRGVVCFF